MWQCCYIIITIKLNNLGMLLFSKGFKRVHPPVVSAASRIKFKR